MSTSVRKRKCNKEKDFTSLIHVNYHSAEDRVACEAGESQSLASETKQETSLDKIRGNTGRLKSTELTRHGSLNNVVDVFP
jgi:hypothetical protein